MLFAAESSDIVIIATAILAFLGTVVTGILTYKLAQLAKVTEKTHDLVNSASVTQAGFYAAACRRIAVLTKDPVDIEEADKAEKTHREKVAEQKVLEAKNGKKNGKFPVLAK